MTRTTPRLRIARPALALLTAAVTLITATLPTGAAYAESAQQTYDRLFAPRELKVRATPTTKDDVELVADLLEHARQHRDDDGTVVLLNRKIAELAKRDVDAYLMAAESHLLVARLVPEKLESGVSEATSLIERTQRLGTDEQKVAAGEMWLEAQALLARGYVDARQYDAAKLLYDAVIKKAEAAGSPKAAVLRREVRLVDSRKKVLKLADEMRAEPRRKLELSRELMWTYVLELDNPEQAERYAMPAGDFTVGPYFTLAARPVDKLSDAEALKLGDWYAALLATPESSDRADIELRRDTARRRVIACYERYLAAHPAKDADHLRIVEVLTQVGGRPAAEANADPATDHPASTRTAQKPTTGDNPFLDVLPSNKNETHAKK
ncbi:MAG: hypothetical protein GC159_17635 [Phycisphaera sp.]|nr:hypothetical protein [Phycisphaera sp.]